MESPKIVIVGSSYSSAAVFYYLQDYLAKSRQPFDILLISEKNCYFFKSFYSQLVSSNCDLSDVGQEFRQVGLLRAGVSYLETKISDINLESNLIKTQKGEIPYTYLVLACENDLNSSEFLVKDSNCFEVNTVIDVLKVKIHILKSLETAASKCNDETKKMLMTFSIIGAQKEGIEIAFSIYDFVSELLKKQFPELKKSLLTINLIEKNNVISISKDPIFNSHIFYNLNKKRIKLYSNSSVINIEKNRIEINNNSEISSGTIIFSGRNKSSSLLNSLQLQKDALSKAYVDLYSQAQGMDNIFLIGECSKCLDLGEDLIQNDLLFKEQAKICAYNVFAKINNNPLKPLKNNIEIDYISLGSRSSLMGIKGVSFDGFLAWFFHRIIYIWCFLGFKKKITTFISLLLNVLQLRENILFNVLEQKKEKQLVKK